MAGSASTVPAFLLLEYPGPWGLDAVRDARWPDDLGPRLRAHAREAGARLLLIRRPGRSRPPVGHRVFAVNARPHHAWAEAVTVADLRELLDIDLSPLSEGRSVGLDRHDQPVFAVCTHGRHDACCAERGRPVAAALAEVFSEETWEVSHIGGDRFAGNMLVAPDGLYYGRLDPRSAVAVAEARMRGEIELDHLRGRTGYATSVQAAEIALRRHLGVTALDGLRLVGRTTGESGHSTATFDHDGVSYLVRVHSVKTEPVSLSCHAARPQSAQHHEVVEIVQL